MTTSQTSAPTAAAPDRRRVLPQADGSDSPRRWTALKVVSWASLVANILIIATGGAVRLTGSGLGCPTWPLCTPDSLVPTQELTWHSLIEFGNRLMTGVLGIIAIAVLVLSWRWRNARRDLFVLAIIVIAGILAQAVVGGITVWTGLNPFVVGFHYVASLILIAITATFVFRILEPAGPRDKAAPVPFIIVTHVTTLVFAVTIILGVLTTGAGPHSGDASVIRTGVDASVLAHWHSWPGYTLVVMNLVLLIWAGVKRLRSFSKWLLLLALLIVQIIVGVFQARNGLPSLSVGIHMVLAGVATAVMVWVVMTLKRPAVAAAAAPEPAADAARAAR